VRAIIRDGSEKVLEEVIVSSILIPKNLLLHISNMPTLATDRLWTFAEQKVSSSSSIVIGD